MITRSPDEGGVTCGSGRAPASVEVTGACGGAARCGGQAPGLPATLPGGAVETAQGLRCQVRPVDLLVDLGWRARVGPPGRRAGGEGQAVACPRGRARRGL